MACSLLVPFEKPPSGEANEEAQSEDWVLWDTGEDVQSYARSMRDGSRWGGAMELALCAQLRKATRVGGTRVAGEVTQIPNFGP